MAKHTPGPWSIGRLPNSVLSKRQKGYSYVTYGLLNVRVETDEEADANARLIAAAPELLAALVELYENATDRGETEDDDTGEEYEDWKAARLAIAKALGKEA